MKAYGGVDAHVWIHNFTTANDHNSVTIKKQQNSSNTGPYGTLKIGIRVLTAVTMTSTIFWGVTPCSLVEYGINVRMSEIS
jgi:hypothetical protein